MTSTIEGGDWRLTLAPEAGGAIASLTWRGRDVLRPAREGAESALDMGCFPLTPYTNRIAGGRFAFDGREVVLKQRDIFAANALHGDGWISRWLLERCGGGSAVLTHRHNPDEDWPWAYEATQTLALSGDGVLMELRLRNADARAMPAGLGFHPYFVRDREARLTARTTGVWQVDAALIPTELAPPSAVFDWSDGPRMDDAPPIDHAYEGWDQRTRLLTGAVAVTMTSSPNTPWLQIYAPPGGDFCCIEPVTHMPDAVNRPAAPMNRLEPGETLSMWMRLEAERSET